MAPVRLHRFALSGHSHRVQLFLSLLGHPVELVDVDLVDGAHKRAPFLALNPFGQVPVIEDGDVVLADSNAILVYLAQRYDPDRRWYPPALAAEIQRWLSVAAGELVRGPADARRASVFGARVDIAEARAKAGALFALLEQHLGARAFLAGSAPTIADLALYTYTAHAPEGGVGLADYPAVCGWLGRIEALPGFVPMAKTPVEA